MDKEYDVKIIYVRYPDGSIPVLDLIKEVVRRGKRDPLFARLAQHIWNAFATLELRGVPDWNIRNFQYEWMVQTERGWTVRVDPLVKRLNHAYPLFELRINEWRYRGQTVQMGYGFRIIFFTYYQGFTQYIFLINGMIKREKSPPRFNELIEEAKWIYQDFLDNKSKYLRGN